MGENSLRKCQCSEWGIIGCNCASPGHIIKTFLNIRLGNGRITDIKDVKSFCWFVPDLNCKQPFQLSCASLMMQTKNININVMYGNGEKEKKNKKRKIMRRCIYSYISLFPLLQLLGLTWRVRWRSKKKKKKPRFTRPNTTV